VEIDRQQRQLFESTYRRLVREHGVTSDAEELALVEELLDDARNGAVPDDDGRIAHVSTSVSPDLDAELAELGGKKGFDVSNLSVRKLIAPAAFLLVALVLVVVALLQGGGNGEATPTPEGGVITTTATVSTTATLAVTEAPNDATPTPQVATPTSSSATPMTPLPSPTPIPTVALPEVEGAPTQVILDGATFPVVLTGVAGGEWRVDARPDVASWLAGTKVNKVFALYGEGNRGRLVALAPGDQITVRDDREHVTTYEVSRSEPVPRTETEILGQTSPGLVIVLAGADGSDASDTSEERWAVVAQPK
jgi:hypothetical protein